MKIIIDVMSGDNAPQAQVEGAVMAVKEYGCDIIMVGDESKIKPILNELGASSEPKLSIVHTSQTIDMNDDAQAVVKTKKDSSMAIAMTMLAESKGDALVITGNTGAVLVGGSLIVKRVKGVRRAALVPVLPTSKGGAVLIDCGANVECTPDQLMQFALMGSIYAQNTLKIQNPRVGLLNNGEEETKGTELYVQTHQLLKQAHGAGKINFVGNVEGRDVPMGACDVIVCDGFTGNILLKTVEGVGMFFLKEIKTMLMSNTRSKLAAMLLKPALRAFKKKLDYAEVGGAPLLGVSKPIMKGHGSSNPLAVKNAIGMAINYAQSGCIEKMEEVLSQ